MPSISSVSSLCSRPGPFVPSRNAQPERVANILVLGQTLNFPGLAFRKGYAIDPRSGL